MEVIIWTIFAAVWWMTSLSVLLPFLLILYFNKGIRNKWFSFYFSKIVDPIFGPMIFHFRIKAFEDLKKQLSERNKTGPLDVLEIGIGTGANLKLYPDNVNLSVLDMNIEFEKYFREQRKKFPNINYDKTFINFAENMKDVDDNSFDLVVSTYVLCSVNSVESVLKEVKRVLKPGGMYLFLDHVSYPPSDVRYYLQKFITPLWKIYFNGCCLDRNHDVVLKETGFRQVSSERICSPNIWIFFRPMLMGIATK